MLAGLVFLFLRLLRRRRENGSLFGRSRPADPPHIVALRDLEKIRSQKLWQNDRQKQFYTAVTDTLRQYVASFYAIPAMEQTTAEIFRELSGREIDAALLGQKCAGFAMQSPEAVSDAVRTLA